MKYKYSYKAGKENTVKVVGRDLSISRKQAIEMCGFIRGKQLSKAKAMLEKVVEKTLAVPYRRFTEGAGHKNGIGSGKYPLNASTKFIMLINSLEANAQNKGLSSDLVIVHASAQQAPRPFHSGRQRRIKMKRCHVELVAQETGPEQKKERKGRQDVQVKAEDKKEHEKKEKSN